MSADADDIVKEYSILLKELEKHNPELLDKERVLAISKSDLLDDELKIEISATLTTVSHLYISSWTAQGFMALKDAIWRYLN